MTKEGKKGKKMAKSSRTDTEETNPKRMKLDLTEDNFEEVLDPK
jgi:hypothetical protein